MGRTAVCGRRHGLALMGLALLFVLEERHERRREMSQLSATDITELPHWQFATQPSREAVIDNILRRHARREAATRSKQRVAQRKSRHKP